MPLSSFHPLVRSWFAAAYGKATEVQEAAWPLIARGENVLAIAPTGSGKTLTAFLAAISRFIDGTYNAAELAVLYVSPLKALNEDIRRNILEPLRSLKEHFKEVGEAFPGIRVETRSGDTPESQRRRFLVSPPSVLAVTPESLAILLLNPRGREALSKVKYLILDEIHSVLAGKRGAFLSCQIDRLALIAGEFQRTALSATVRPESAAAEFAGGLGRTVRIVSPKIKKRIELQVDFPPGPPAWAGQDAEPSHYGERYAALVETVLERLGFDGERCRRTVLVFTSSRQRAERIALLVNKRAGELAEQKAASTPLSPPLPEPIAFAHHGSLSREVRRVVEERLAEGRISCVAATGSLELGIDIGGVDEVILAGSPGSAAAALQRIGRSGHGVGRVSRGLIVPFYGMELIMAAALAGAVEEREIEESFPVENPLDILAQVILELCAEKNWHTGELYKTLRGFYVFKTLPRSSFDAVILMLSGYYGENRIRELKGRLYFDRLSGEIQAADGLLRTLYTAGGVIANRGYFSLRLGDGTKIGELDEEFVWERRIGDSFEFGSRPWTISAIGSEAVTVIPSGKPSEFAPFYRAEAVFRSPVLSRRILELFSLFNDRKTVDFPSFSPAAVEALFALVMNQIKAQEGIPLPGPGHIPVEIIDDPSRTDVYQVVFHSFRGGAVNYPLAMALSQDLEDSLGTRIESMADDDAVLLFLPRIAGEKPERLIRQSILGISGGKPGGERGETLFRRRLEASGLFGAAFREAAERSLILTKTSFGKRTPLWFSRQRSRRLFDAVSGIDDFPLTAEAWRSCLKDRFDLPGLAALIGDIASETVKLSFFRTRLPSPFAREQVWKDVNAHMYEYDERPDLRMAGLTGKVSLADQIIRDALENSGGRPPLPEDVRIDFCARLKREVSGWAPSSVPSLCEWVRERIAIPLDEWENLLAVLPEEVREELRLDAALGGRITRIKREGAGTEAVVHRDLAETWMAEAVCLLGPWLRFQGPVALDRISAVFGTDRAETESAAFSLCESGELVRDIRVAGTETRFVCDRENLEILLRLTRKKSRPRIAERPVSVLIPFLARRQGIRMWDGDSLRTADSVEALVKTVPPWEKLQGYAAQIQLWERDIFPCREGDYNPEKLDRAIAAGELFWYGTGHERAAFSLPAAADLVLPERTGEEELPELFLAHRAFFERERDFWEIREAFGLDTRSCAEAIWNLVWQGLLSSDTWESVRRFVERGAVPKDFPEETASPPLLRRLPRGFGPHRIPRALRDRWREGPPVPGRWFSLEPSDGESGGADPLDEENLNRERIRLLLDRWGVLARPFLEREAPCLSWAKLLPVIRRMELAGELYSGRFFGGINSLQFATPGIEKELLAAENETGLYWMNACDPASPAALELEGLPFPLPSRLPGVRLCFRGTSPMYISAKNGRELEIFFPPEDPGAPRIMALLLSSRGPSFRKTIIEKINGISASGSPYSQVLKTLGFLPDRDKLVFW
ncbi:MAG: DEAD/DEAH box helicase [Treponema sp.]|jgi:ATP-dependent Lhr-like helicase|nr:DEAD/DEAH box helicase [Treponema sp.]